MERAVSPRIHVGLGRNVCGPSKILVCTCFRPMGRLESTPAKTHVRANSFLEGFEASAKRLPKDRRTSTCN